jgi:ParB family transcriptional regulator, chromosome partitioning protein
MQNIMMMFAIHNTRREWDPLPTAYKLQQLEQLHYEKKGKSPTEGELAQLASMTRGEVRRLKSILALPKVYREELIEEAKKPRQDQALTVDYVLEATKGANALRKREIINDTTEKRLTAAIVNKYKTGVVRNTVEPRQLARIARAVDREELPKTTAARLVARIIEEPNYSIAQAFNDSVARIDYEHTLEQQADRLSEKLSRDLGDKSDLGPDLRRALNNLLKVVARILGA